MSTLKVNTLEEATVGGATFFTAKAWVNFNGTGTVAIRDDGNVSTITDYGTGNYGVNFSNSLSSSNYVTSSDSNGLNTSTTLNSQTAIFASLNGGSDPTTSAFRLVAGNSANASTKQDKTFFHVMAVL